MIIEFTTSLPGLRVQDGSANLAVVRGLQVAMNAADAQRLIEAGIAEVAK